MLHRAVQRARARPALRGAQLRVRGAPKRAFNDFPRDAAQPESRVRQILSTVFLKRFLAYSAFGFALTAIGCLTGVEGAHVYVEAIALAPEKDRETKHWQWDRELDDWGGGLERGGTDSRLGFVGQHLVRSAWMAQTWGMSSSGADNRLLWAHAFLLNAIHRAHKRDPNSLALPVLMHRDAAVLERLGTRPDLSQAVDRYMLAMAAHRADSPERARIAAKIGDIAARLGESDSARIWWTDAVRRASRQDLPEDRIVPKALPESPYDQRTLCTALLALSSSYSAAGNFKQAAELQRSARALIAPHAITPSPSQDAVRALPAHLHAYFLAHRSSLFAIHLAEVTFATAPKGSWLPFKSKSSSPAEPESPLGLLRGAAEASERIALALQGLPHTPVPPPSAADGPLLPAFAKASRALREPAAALLRDARRSAAQAWRLSGILHSAQGEDGRALDCFTRALAWAGAGEPAPDTLEVEWQAIWTAYTQTKDRLGPPKEVGDSTKPAAPART
ncbi:hypothetical protein AURDEDRAFT_185117 [Auricularia subglabra TFB-10046 SS5]|nr:hypothetical protein AURDEDRAFT_185117 [Auricularia subglabra TFB-10046 SS5]